MFHAVDKEDDIELDDLRHDHHASPPQELLVDANTSPNANPLGRLNRSHCNLGTGLVRTHSVDNYDSVSGLDRNDEASVPDLLKPSIVHHHASNNATSCVPTDKSSASPLKRVARAVQPFHTTSDPSSRASNHSPSLSSEIASHTSKDKSKGRDRIPNIEQEHHPSVILDHPQFFDGEIVPHTGKGEGHTLDIKQQRSGERDGHPYDLLRDSRLEHTLLSSNYHERDAQFDRHRYYREKNQRLPGAGGDGDFCTAVRRDKCKVHGNLFQKGVVQDKGSAGRGLGHASTNGFVDDVLDRNESARRCGTVYDQSGLAEDAGQPEQAQKKSKLDWSICVCGNGLMLVFVYVLAVVAVFIAAVKSTRSDIVQLRVYTRHSQENINSRIDAEHTSWANDVTSRVRKGDSNATEGSSEVHT